MEDTRQVFLGEAALATGFLLAGFEVHPDAGIEELESLLDHLRATRTPAFVVIDQRLAETPSRRLDEVRGEGGRILLTQVPSLTEPDAMRSSVDDRINQLLGIEEPIA